MTVTELAGPKLIELPRDGYSLYFKEANHAYHQIGKAGPGRRMPGASTVSKAFPDSPDGLMFWVEKMALDGVARLSAAQVTIPEDPFVLRQVLENHELRWGQLRDKAAERGTNIHVQVLEALARGDEIPDLEVLPGEQRGYGQAVFRWWNARKPRPLNVEQIILSKEHNYAGRFDLRCQMDDPFTDTETWLWDLKTSKRPYASDHIQLRLYAMAAVECGIGGAERLGILQVKEDGTYIEHPCAATEAHALLAIQSYAARKEVDKAMKAAA